MGVTGLEHGTESPGNPRVPVASGAECGAVGAPERDSPIQDAELRRIVDAWADLPAAIRRAMLAMIDAGDSDG